MPGKLGTQRVSVNLNGHPVATFTLSTPEAQTQTISLPKQALQEDNVLTFEASHAESPQKLGVEPDPRPRAIKINWIEFVFELTTKTEGFPAATKLRMASRHHSRAERFRSAWFQCIGRSDDHSSLLAPLLADC